MSFLKLLVRQTLGVKTAKAACPVECYDVHWCDVTRWYKRRCCDHANCTTTCTAWSYLGDCP